MTVRFGSIADYHAYSSSAAAFRQKQTLVSGQNGPGLAADVHYDSR
jgi:hypothetical protein